MNEELKLWFDYTSLFHSLSSKSIKRIQGKNKLCGESRTLPSYTLGSELSHRDRLRWKCTSSWEYKLHTFLCSSQQVSDALTEIPNFNRSLHLSSLKGEKHHLGQSKASYLEGWVSLEANSSTIKKGIHIAKSRLTVLPFLTCIIHWHEQIHEIQQH